MEKYVKDKKEEEEKENSKKIILLIVLVIILLSLITSCSCTSQFFGRMGDFLPDSINNLFRNEEDHSIGDGTNDEETILEQELELDAKSLEMSLDDPDAKISFTYKNINPKKFTCSTSDASVATCYVKNGYVVVIPKTAGFVKVMLQAKTNGKKFESSSKVTITDSAQNNAITNNNNNNNNPNNNLRPTYPNNNNGTGNNNSNSGTSGGNGNNGGGNTGGNTGEGGNKPGDDTDYHLYTYKQKYDMSYVNGFGESSIILNTNLFNNKSVDVVDATNKKVLQLCSNDKNYCVNLTVDSKQDEGNIEIMYVGNKSGPTSLPFQIVANSTGKSIIHVSGVANNNTFINFDIEIDIDEKYIVTISANGGTFNTFTTEYQFRVSDNEEIDLSKYDEPYKLNEEECKYYQFKGYSRTPDGVVEYNRNDKNIIRDIKGDLTLYAVYSSESIPVDETMFKKTLWLTDVALFHNSEYSNSEKEDKVIYPGATGTYIMNLKNESSNKVTVTGMTLKENTVCVSEDRCLNMGYIIKHSRDTSNNWNYYYGDENSKYWILHSHDNTQKLSYEKFQSDIEFNDRKIEIEPNETIMISVFWKWEEVDDKLDTEIGNHAAEKITNETINDIYSISIGINFDTKNNSCPK